MKLIICLALLTGCLAAPATDSKNAVELPMMELELDPNQPLIGLLREEDLDPATRGVISDFIRAPFRTATTTAEGQPVYAVQLGPFPLINRPFVFFYPWNRVVQATTTTAAPV